MDRDGYARVALNLARTLGPLVRPLCSVGFFSLGLSNPSDDRRNDVGRFSLLARSFQVRDARKHTGIHACLPLRVLAGSLGR